MCNDLYILLLSYYYVIQTHSKKAVDRIFLAVGKFKRINKFKRIGKRQGKKYQRERGRSILTKLVNEGKFGMELLITISSLLLIILSSFFSFVFLYINFLTFVL
jgi:hypothetical protein